jgi:alcohol dehydrogenase
MGFFAATRGPRSITVGAGQRHGLANHVRRKGSRVLICTDERMAADAVTREMIDRLSAAGVQAKVFDQSLPEVPIEAIDQAVAMGRAFGPDVVLGLGGGSCMDMAKMTALLLAHGGRPSAYYGEFKVPGPVMPIICMPTTAGTGSEVTPVAVIADPEKTMKVGISSPELIPEIAICDPELTLTCPPGLTAVSGSDALTHAIEALMAVEKPVTPELTTTAVFVGKNAFSDMYALTAISNISKYLERAVTTGSDLEAREGMMWASMLAGLAFGAAGTAAAHALQYPVGAITHTAHGAGVACLLPYVMEFNSPVSRASLLRIADAMGVPSDVRGEEARAAAAIDAVADLFARVKIPLTIKDLGLADDQLDWAAEQAMGAARLVNNNPRKLDLAAMGHILRAAQSGDRAELRKLPV